MTEVLVGSKIPLSVQAHDENPSLKIEAILFSINGEQLDSTFLYHAKNGLYLNTELEMPNKIVIATYSVKNSEEYMTGAEKFSPLQPDKSPEKYISGFVTEKMTDTEFIVGVISEVTNF